jgi:hypothetical protein
MSIAEARAALARKQTKVLQALIVPGTASDKANAPHLRATAEALARKRRRSVARAWPILARNLGSRFNKLFAVFAAQTTLPSEGGALADGRAFARFLARTGDLSEAGRMEALAVDLRFAPCAGGLVPRRGPALKMALFQRPRRLVVALRLPWAGEKWLTLPLGWQ